MAFKFEKLKVWLLSMDLSEEVNSLTERFPSKELFNLSSQIRRAADSVSLNIAEGSSSATNPEQARFLNIAVRSCSEVVCCLYKAKRRNYLKDAEFNDLYNEYDKLTAQLQALRNFLLKINPAKNNSPASSVIGGR